MKMSLIIRGHVPALIVFFSLFLRISLRAADPVFGGMELERLVALAMENNPDVCAARNVLDRLEAGHESEFGFFDPRLSFSTGRGRWSYPVPWSSQSGYVDDNSISGRVGLEFPVLPGAYVNLGISERYLFEPGDDDDSLYQTVAGGQVWIPLLRDRGLAEWKARESVAERRKGAAGYALMDVMQKVRWEVELAYVDLLRAAAGIGEAESSADRVAKLLEEAEELVALKAVPAYQLHPAKMEVALHQEELLFARHAFQKSLLRMSVLTGVDIESGMDISEDAISRLAEACGDPLDVDIEGALRARGVYLALESEMQAMESDIRLAGEKLKSEFGFSMKVVWQGESEDNFIGTDLLVSDRHFGTEFAVVWRRPLGFRSERADIAASRARLREIGEEMRGVRLRVESEMAVARDAFKSASERLSAAHAAFGEAEKALMAEDERFRLGEGRSRNVLDAQKDLSTVMRRRNNAAAELLKAFINTRYMSGYDMSGALRGGGLPD